MILSIMSFKNNIFDTLKNVANFNKIELKDLKVEYESVLNIDRVEKVDIYKVKIVFINNKVLFDYFKVFFNPFIVRFLIYRCFIHLDERTFYFTLRLRNLNVMNEVIKKE